MGCDWAGTWAAVGDILVTIDSEQMRNMNFGDPVFSKRPSQEIFDA
jgi:glycerol-3-phosphate dehydrogenase